MDADHTHLMIICPFIKDKVVKDLLRHHPRKVRVITRFNLSDFALGVSDVAALRTLLQSGARVRGVRNLHTKLYVFGRRRAIITSANLTEAGLNRNHEFGIVTDKRSAVKECRAYFNRLWESAESDLRIKDVNAWDSRVTQYQLLGGRPEGLVNLEDYGKDAGFTMPESARIPVVATDASRAFVKFQGNSDNRMSLSDPTQDELINGGCHWAVCYSRRRRAVKDGDVVFIGRLTKNPNDIRIFGRAIGLEYKEGRDDASPAEIEDKEWKERFSHYIRGP